ncbi:MAG TPA: hypothetical protein VMU14_16440 [Acidimicrobiales bacterium]|nr:hypothetical protein [Acidimicrobiales bacterium]
MLRHARLPPHNLGGIEEHEVVARSSLPAGRHTLAFRFERTAEHSGTGALFVDGLEVGRAELPRVTPGRFSLTGAGVTCGYSGNLPVAAATAPPATFTGTIQRVVVQVEGTAPVDAASEVAAAMMSQ